jgi:hypothetical protein
MNGWVALSIALGLPTIAFIIKMILRSKEDNNI